MLKSYQGDLKTYIYGINDEAKYHKDYQDSCFGVTMKKLVGIAAAIMR